jgi:hypothetical protein
MPGAGDRHQQHEHHLNTVKRSPDAQNENWLNSIARKRSTKTPCSLFAIDSPIPKLDVAGSNPVSRSNFSTTWDLSGLYANNGVRLYAKNGGGVSPS